MSNTTPTKTPRPAARRPATAGERSQLAAWLVKQGYEANKASRLAENAYLAVFDNCVAPGGYRGRGMTVIWGQPHLFTWEGGTLHHHMPCAGCRNEAPGTIDTASVSDTA